MAIPIREGGVHAAVRSCRLAVLENRRLTLERLYQRKLVVEELIRSLEGYQDVERPYPVLTARTAPAHFPASPCGQSRWRGRG